MNTLRKYHWFAILRALIAPLMALVLLGSQFPLSSHCYKSLFNDDHHSEEMTCMRDGVCMMETTTGIGMECECHKKHVDRPFFCSCDVSGKNLINGIQVSKVLIPDFMTPDTELNYSFIPFWFKKSELQSCSKDIFHPPKFA